VCPAPPIQRCAQGLSVAPASLLQRAPFVSAPAAADALVLVALVVLLELGGIAAVLAAIRMAGFDFARAAFVLALFLHMIDFHLCSSLLRLRCIRSSREPPRFQALQRKTRAGTIHGRAQAAVHGLGHAVEQQMLD